VSDALTRVVDGDGELICEQSVAPADDKVSDIGMYVMARVTLNSIVETDLFCGDSQPHRQGSSDVAHTVAAPSGITHLVGLSIGGLGRLNFCSTARTRKSLACLNQSFECSRVKMSS
jgi:hypothetical protein